MRGFTLQDLAPQIDLVKITLPGGKTWCLPVVPLTFDEEVEIELSVTMPTVPKINKDGETVDNPADKAYQDKLSDVNDQLIGRKVFTMIRKANAWLKEHPDWLGQHPEAMPLLDEGDPDRLWATMAAEVDSSLVKALRRLPLTVNGTARAEVQRLAQSFRPPGKLAGAGDDAPPDGAGVDGGAVGGAGAG